MIEITRNNVRHIRPLSPAEARAKEAWFKDKPTAQVLALKAERGGRFCVVQGDYRDRPTKNIREGLEYLSKIGRHLSPAARFLGRELMRRSSGVWSATPGNPDGPQAA